MSELDIKRANTLSDNIEILMETADLTIEGIAEFADISRATVNRALLKMSNISPPIVLKIANAFNLSSNELTDKPLEKIQHICKLKGLVDFKDENVDNFNLFISESEKHNAQLFVKKELLKDSYYLKERKKKDMIERLKKSENFQQEFTKAALEQSIKRILDEEDFLTVPRKSKNGKVFYYKVKNR